MDLNQSAEMSPLRNCARTIKICTFAKLDYTLIKIFNTIVLDLSRIKYIMKLAKNIIAFASVLAFVLFSSVNAFAGNPVDSDISNTAGTNSGNSHLDIYLFIVALLVLVVVVPFFEDKNKKKHSKSV